MARQQTGQANQLYNTSMGVGNAAGQRQGALFNTLSPIFSQEATNPQGFAPKDLAAMNTASSQSVGGSTAGAVGQGNLEASRTRNSAGYAPALDESVKSGERTLSNNALNVQGKNAMLKETQRQSGIEGMQGLESGQQTQLMQSLGLANGAIQSGTQAGKSGWFQNMLGLIEALSPKGSTSNGGSLSFGG